MRLFGLIGYPLAQSFSKKYFDEKFAKEGLSDCRFENFSISSIELLDNLLQENHELEGLAITIPYKKQVLRFLDNDENIPAGLRACNCIRLKNAKLSGFNTDHLGFEKSFVPYLRPGQDKALVLGNGGATEAVVYVLKKLGISYQVVSRKLLEGSDLTYEDLNQDLVSTYTIIINTSPVGMYPSTEDSPAIPYQFISNDHYCYDLVYNPEKTAFLTKAEAQGAVIKNGLDMLIYQAEENWKIWNS